MVKPENSKSISGLTSRETAVAVRYDAASRSIHVDMEKGFTVSFRKDRCQLTAAASDQDLQEVTLQGAGTYVIFPRLDDGLTVEGILAGRFGNERWEADWAAHHEPVAA